MLAFENKNVPQTMYSAWLHGYPYSALLKGKQAIVHKHKEESNPYRNMQNECKDRLVKDKNNKCDWLKDPT